MATAHTRVTVANRALDLVSENPLVTLNDAGPYARWINRNYTPTVRSTLRTQPWNFAKEMHRLVSDPTQPAFRWRYRYQLPNGWLRVLQPTVTGAREARPLKYEVNGNFLLMDQRGPRPVELIMDKQEPGEWDDLFAEVVAIKLALGMSYRFTGKERYTDRMIQLGQEAMDAAVEANTLEGTVDNAEQFDIIRARNGWNVYDDDDWSSRRW